MSEKKDKKSKKDKTEKAEKPEKAEKNEKPQKVAKKGNDENQSAPKKVERGPHTLPDDDIDTKGKAQTLAAGGSIIFRCIEVKDIKKKDDLHYTVKIDGEDKYHTKQAAKGDKFDGETFQDFTLASEAKTVTVELNNKGLISTHFCGEVRLDVSDLRDGYPYDKWYPLVAKVGKEKKKTQGQVHLQVLYLAPNTKPRHDEFTKPLISLIASDRLDLFSRKIEDLGGKGNVSDKSNEKDAVTPLVFAAIEGKPGFVKLLIENGADISKETDKEGLNAIHLAAKHSHHVALRYLLKQKGAPINAPDTSSLKNTPLHVAAAENAGESVAILIQAGAEVNATNSKNDTPLHYALCQASGAPKSVLELVKGGADVYAKGSEGLPAWEVAQRKDLCSSPQTRNSFMKACEVQDPREFPLQQKLPVKQRVSGENLTGDWNTATQFIFKSKKEETTEVTVLLYPVQRNDDWTKQIGFCVIKDNESVHTLPSFQPEGLGFGGSEAFKCVCEPDSTYTVVSFATDKELEGQFGLCFFQKAGREELDIRPAQKWKYTQSTTGGWKGDTAAGSAFPAGWKNTKFIVSCDSDKEQDCYVMIAQKSKDVSAIVFDDNRIVPAKYYIGVSVFSADKKTELAKSKKWHNSKDVYLKFRVGGEHKSVILIPSTVMPGEEQEYELSVFCDTKVSLKKEK